MVLNHIHLANFEYNYQDGHVKGTIFKMGEDGGEPAINIPGMTTYFLGLMHWEDLKAETVSIGTDNNEIVIETVVSANSIKANKLKAEDWVIQASRGAKMSLKDIMAKIAFTYNFGNENIEFKINQLDAKSLRGPGIKIMKGDKMIAKSHWAEYAGIEDLTLRNIIWSMKDEKSKLDMDFMELSTGKFDLNILNLLGKIKILNASGMDYKGKGEDKFTLKIFDPEVVHEETTIETEEDEAGIPQQIQKYFGIKLDTKELGIEQSGKGNALYYVEHPTLSADFNRKIGMEVLFASRINFHKNDGKFHKMELTDSSKVKLAINDDTTIEGTLPKSISFELTDEGLVLQEKLELNDVTYLRQLPKKEKKEGTRDMEEYEVVHEYKPSGKFDFLNAIQDGSFSLTLFNKTVRMPIVNKQGTDKKWYGGLVDLEKFVEDMEDVFTVATDDLNNVVEDALEFMDVEEEQGELIPMKKTSFNEQTIEHLFLQLSVLNLNKKILLPNSKKNMVRTKEGSFVPLSKMLDYLFTFDPNLKKEVPEEGEKTNEQMVKDQFNKWNRDGDLTMNFNIVSVMDFKNLPKEQRSWLKFITSDKGLNLNLRGYLESGKDLDKAQFVIEVPTLKIPESEFGNASIQSIKLDSAKLVLDQENNKLKITGKKIIINKLDPDSKNKK